MITSCGCLCWVLFFFMLLEGNRNDITENRILDTNVNSDVEISGSDVIIYLLGKPCLYFTDMLKDCHIPG